MYALWVSLRGDANCRSKLSDVIQGHERTIEPKSRRKSKHDLFHRTQDCQTEQVISHDPITKWFYVVEIGDPSRNVIEMIFRAKTTRPLKGSMKINQVLKLNNSKTILENFEIFREAVKNKAYEHYNNKHPRSMVDGNEQLLFYGTTITCCRGKQYEVPKLCKDLNCSICSIIRSGFITVPKKTGICLSRSCEDFLNEDADFNTKRKNVKRAIVVCRVIAGRITNIPNWDYENDYDSIVGVTSKDLIVKDPHAVLPCFVIILN